MKREFAQCPEAVDEGRLFGFAAWQEYVAAVPAPLVAVTGYKLNGKANVTMQSWCAMHGDHMLFAGVDKGSHLYSDCQRGGGAGGEFPHGGEFS
ncbi:hypothetical protein D7X94_01755 [Acutalibacter sp. 1XD8-33]|uniref:hypothetical protein n=1 Tax=Acutalibacter sp. 1XD8-33 TaxID=2320081 RepID=UPI000EA206DF|nr:hypothetical protein [Acutalibacter sp. 1XD8-33]RKJ42224.1 hypothetical protein D7X94_01755 [Acutalibacter sp. 1XD8-33]